MMMTLCLLGCGLWDTQPFTMSGACHCHFRHSREGPRAVAGRESEAHRGLCGHQASLHRQSPVSVEVGGWPGSLGGRALVAPVVRKNLEEASLSIWGEGERRKGVLPKTL